ncbi:ATP/GTP-binding protein [Streptomyces sp. NPDC052051]|uniref:ATP/GTP-binding protein n=1 Tax=Streptomyces sp. NPDC052051 TaxID=3154649 RepID=UPI00343E164A
MDSDGTQDARGTRADSVPRPAMPPGAPPRPTRAPHTEAPPRPPRSSVAEWLDAPRVKAEPGIWRQHYQPPKTSHKRRLSPATVAGMVIPLVVGLIIWALWGVGAVPYQFAPLRLVTPSDWWWEPSMTPRNAGHVYQAGNGWGAQARAAYNGVAFAVIACAMGRLGSWGRGCRFFFERWPQPKRAAVAAVSALVVWGWVFPSAVPGAFWDPDPVLSTIFNFAVAASDGYEILASAPFVYSVYTAVTLLILWPFARVGDWLPLARTWLAARRRPAEDDAVRPDTPRSRWPELREAGAREAADALGAEVLAGRANDVDCARIGRAWNAARREGHLAAFTETVLRQGGAAWTHPSGARDLPGRTALHDLLVDQVRIGQWVAGEHTPLAYAGAGAALGPDALATSLLAVGPPGSGKTRRLVAPVVENLALEALTGGCAVVAVCAAGTPLAPDAAFDVVVRIGDPESVHDLDPYADCDDPDEAAGFLAEGLVGDLDTVDAQRAVTALAQLLGPYRAVHGAFPSLPVLRELLEGGPSALSPLREALSEERHAAMRRELDARLRQSGTTTDVGPALADRLALLDRPAFAEFFGGGAVRPFSLRAVAHHPLRVRIDLPERGHEEASRLLTRLILAQFDAVAGVGGRPHFACLVLDDATGTVTAESVRRIQRLRSRNAGVLLSLRTIGDVPEALHGPLFGAVGCRMAFSGVTTWDGGRFAQAWGTQWVETREVAQHTVFAQQPMTRAIHALRKLVTGKAVTTDAVTVRQVERERWSASELAHAVPPGHAVLSLTDRKGEHAPPLLVDLRG